MPCATEQTVRHSSTVSKRITTSTAFSVLETSARPAGAMVKRAASAPWRMMTLLWTAGLAVAARALVQMEPVWAQSKAMPQFLCGATARIRTFRLVGLCRTLARPAPGAMSTPQERTP